MAVPKWRQFEKDIQAIFEKNPDAKVTRDAEIVGRSGRKRKLELFIEYPFEIPFAEGFRTKVPIKIAVECKDHRKPVGINLVGQFADTMDDVKAPIGIMVSTSGFDKGAKARAKEKNIYLIHATWDLMLLARGLGEPPRFFCCKGCNTAFSDNDKLGGIVDWPYLGELDSIAQGNCDWCNTIHLMCPDCGEVTGVLDADYDECIECAGICGRVYIADYDLHDDVTDIFSISGVESEILQAAYDNKNTLSGKKVKEILSKSKWQFDQIKTCEPLSSLEHKRFIDVVNGKKSIIKINLTTEGGDFVKDKLNKASSGSYGW